MSHYKLTSTVILHLASETQALGEMDLSGNMTRQVEVDLPVESDASHVANVGRLVEDMELKMRNLLRMYWCRGYYDWNGSADPVCELQRRFTLARLRMLWVSFGVSGCLSIVQWRYSAHHRCFRSGAALRDKSGSGIATGDDQVHAEIVLLQF